MTATHSFIRRLTASRDGNVAVEFALIAPVLILLFTGLIDLGRAFYDGMALETAARSAVQYARQNPGDTTGIRAAALTGSGVPMGATVDPPKQFCECPNGSSIGCGSQCASGEPYLVFLSVTVRENFQSILPYPGLPSPLPLTGSAVLRVQ
ncbi:MAG TPA: TadE/TadG family type IV pilus assembly protein [Azospirillum sp.]|nr:TadE/TadG family type IV pilus assembly protein [Azospirillum sp.]